MAQSARIQLCGRFVVEWDGRAVEASLPGRQGRILLAHLVLRGPHPIGRDELIEALWPRNRPPQAASALNVLVSKTRLVLGPDALTGRSEVRIALPPHARVDVEEALAALHVAQSAAAQHDWTRAWPAAVTARSVAQRRLLPETDLPWVNDWRQRLAVVHAEALECYAVSCLGIGGAELPGAERAARELVRLGPLRESGHRALMEALAARGNIAEALAAYERLRTLLRDELGTDPSRQLQQTHERLLRLGT